MDRFRLHHRVYTCCIIVCTLFTVHGAGISLPTLGFTVLEASGVDPYDASVFSQILRKAIDNAGVYRTLEFSDISIRLAEQGLPKTCYNAHCAIVAGQILGTDYFGFGTIGSVGKTITISMQIVEVRTGRMIRDVSEFYKGKRAGFEKKIIPRFARKLSGIEKEKGRKKRTP